MGECGGERHSRQASMSKCTEVRKSMVRLVRKGKHVHACVHFSVCWNLTNKEWKEAGGIGRSVLESLGCHVKGLGFSTDGE